MKKKRKIIEKEGRFYTSKGAELVRASYTKTESEFWSFIRSALRSASKWWKPKLDYLERHKRKYTGENKRIKHEYQCEKCRKWFVRAKIAVDHIIPCGTLRNYDDVAPFISRLFIEVNGGWQLLCKECHLVKTKSERIKI